MGIKGTRICFKLNTFRSLHSIIQMYLPEDVVKIIRAFSKPIGTRLDWRRCKRNESRRIKGSNRALFLWYKYILGDIPLLHEITGWTFYGRRHLIWESRRRYWSIGLNLLQVEETDPEWYEKRCILYAMQEWPRLMPGPFLEDSMYHVSIII